MRAGRPVLSLSISSRSAPQTSRRVRSGDEVKLKLQSSIEIRGSGCVTMQVARGLDPRRRSGATLTA